MERRNLSTNENWSLLSAKKLPTKIDQTVTVDCKSISANY